MDIIVPSLNTRFLPLFKQDTYDVKGYIALQTIVAAIRMKRSLTKKKKCLEGKSALETNFNFCISPTMLCLIPDGEFKTYGWFLSPNVECLH